MPKRFDGCWSHRVQDTGLRKLLVASCWLPETSSRDALREDIFVTINILLCARRFAECWPNVCGMAPKRGLQRLHVPYL